MIKKDFYILFGCIIAIAFMILWYAIPKPDQLSNQISQTISQISKNTWDIYILSWQYTTQCLPILTQIQTLKNANGILKDNLTKYTQLKSINTRLASD